MIYEHLRNTRIFFTIGIFHRVRDWRRAGAVTMLNNWLATLNPPRELTERLTTRASVDLPKAKVKVLPGGSSKSKQDKTICAHAGCTNKRRVRPDGTAYAYCREHQLWHGRKSDANRRLKRQGVLTEKKQKILKGLCTFEGCNEPRHVYKSEKGGSPCYCKKHLALVRKMGRTEYP